MAKFLDRIMIKALTESGQKIVAQAKINASWSRNIPNAIFLGEANATATGYEISIILNTNPSKGGIPYAAAFEFGSGIHKTRGTPGTYKIRPKNKKALAFQWNPANPTGALFSKKVIDFIPEEDLWIFRYVDHPGVEPRPFLVPAIQDNKPNITARILQAFRSGFRESLGARIEVIS